jgi:HlyD family secretion protein
MSRQGAPQRLILAYAHGVRIMLTGVQQPSSPKPARAARRIAVIAIAALAVLLVVIAAIARWSGAIKATPAYVTAPISRGPVTRTVSATGAVNPRLTIIVGSYVSGVIQELFCDYNTRVKKGQICATIDPRPYQSTVDQATAELGTSLAQLVKDEAGVAYAKTTYDRSVRLVKDGFVTRDQVDSALNVLEQAKASVELDRAAIRQKQASLKAAQINLDYTRIASPVDGTVVSRNVTIGQTVAASFQTPTLFLIATDLTRMQVDTNVSESDIGGLKPGDPATFTVEAFASRVFRGSVTQIRQAPQTVQNVVTYDVIVSVDNDDLALMPGMTATTRIVSEQRTDVLRVPDQALRFSPAAAAAPGGGEIAPHVWVLRNGTPRAVALATGLDDDTYSEITGGDLKPGDPVIVGEQRTAKVAAAPVRFGL